MTTPTVIHFSITACTLALYATALLYVGTARSVRYLVPFELTKETFSWLIKWSTAGLCFHFLDVGLQLHQDQGVHMGLFIMISLANAVSLAFCLALSHWRPSVKPLTLLLLLIAFFSVPASHLLQTSPDTKQSLSLGESIHILLSITAWAILILAWLQSCVAATQITNLKKHRTRSWSHLLPPLEASERILFELLTIGWVVLSLAIISGFLVFEDLLAQHLLHKTFFTLLSWGLLSGVLFRHWRTGWRGKNIVKLARWSIVLMLIGYLGTKVALELILN